MQPSSEIAARLPNDIVVFRATPDQAEMVREVLAKAGEWLLQKGIKQWLQPPPLEELKSAAAQGELYLALRAGVALGTFRLSTHGHPPPWSVDGDDAGYLSSIARHPVLSERILGTAMLHVAQAITHSLGKNRLRLDCWAGNEPLRRLYRNAGFLEVGIAPENDYQICLFEKTLLANEPSQDKS